MNHYDVFTLTETKADKGTEPIKRVLNPLAFVTVSVSVSGQCEHLHIILYNPFLSVSVAVSVSVSLN